MNAKERRKHRRAHTVTIIAVNHETKTVTFQGLADKHRAPFGPWCDRCWSKIKSSDEQHGEGLCEEAMTEEAADFYITRGTI